MEKLKRVRITDISNELCKVVDAYIGNKASLIALYDYHKSNCGLYPMSNWQAHRLRALSCIAVKLNDKGRIKECHDMILIYIKKDSVCHDKCGANQDFHYRDAINYLVYGSQALASACLYLKPFTKYNYHSIFDSTMLFLKPYLSGSKKHIEYVKSNIKSDVDKPEYDKVWDPNYAKPFLTILEKLK